MAAASKANVKSDGDAKSSAPAASAASNSGQTAKARGLVAEGDEKVTAWTFFASSGTANKEAAVELYEKAAALFKLSKEWEEAAKAYVKAAETSEKYLKAESEACNFYLQAAKAYKNAGSKEANKWFKMVVSLHMENNRFSTAAKIYKEIAEIEEKENNIPAAVAAWEKAADCHFAEDQQNSGNQCLLKVAHWVSLHEDYKKAIDIYEKVATASLSNQLMSYSVKEYLFKAALCHFVLGSKNGDIAPVIETNDKYKQLSSMWDGSREGKLVEQLLKAYEAGDAQKFTDHLFSYDRISKLDTWTSTLLLTIKKQLQSSTTAVSASTIKFASATAAAAAEPNMQGDDATATTGTTAASGTTAAGEPDMM